VDIKLYTYSEARQNLARLLDEAKEDGKIHIKSRDGRTYILKPLQEENSPLDVKGVESDLTREELNSIVREGRERYTS
jgi:hypothetical protein